MARSPPYFLTIPPEQLSEGICPECGVQTDLWQGFCLLGTNCRYDYEGRVQRHVVRAVDAGVPYVWFDPRDIFEASGWKCYLCGVDTPRSHYGKAQAASPQLDHVIPLSRGGAHSPENCECSCARCNMLKSDLSLEELGLSPRRLPPDILAGIPRAAESPWAEEKRRLDEMLANNPLAMAGRLAAEEALAEHRRNGWKPPEPKVRRPKRTRLIE